RRLFDLVFVADNAARVGSRDADHLDLDVGDQVAALDVRRDFYRFFVLDVVVLAGSGNAPRLHAGNFLVAGDIDRNVSILPASARTEDFVGAANRDLHTSCGL